MKTIKVFEYDKINIGEQGFKEKHWVALSKFNERQDNKFFTVYHNGIKFNNYVGVIQAGSLTIEILPKADKLSSEEADKDKWHKALLKMLKECKLINTDYPDFANLSLTSNSILDLYLGIYLSELQKIVHQGLIKKYRRNTANKPALKGKLLLSEHVRKNVVDRSKFYVEYSTYDTNHLLHRIILKTLKLINKISTNPNIKGRAQTLLLDFPELENIIVTEKTFEGININRKSEVYRQVLLISKMLLLNYRPDITGGDDNVLALLFDMNKLWEEYVYRQILKINTDNFNISRQNSTDFWSFAEQQKPVSLRPDIVIEISKGNVVVLDTKWKLIEGYNPSAKDLQQLFAYSQYYKSNNTILLYPALSKSKQKGTYKQKHVIYNDMENIHCSVLAIPLRWSNDNLMGLDINMADIETM